MDDASKKAHDKITKLLRLSRSDNMHEAAAALGRAQALATENFLDIEGILSGDEMFSDDESRWKIQDCSTLTICTWKRRVRWHALLLQGVTKANNCDWYSTQGGSGEGIRVVSYGQPNDIKTVSYLFKAMVSEVDRVTKIKARGMGRSYAFDFRLGMACEISSRIREAADKAVSRAKSKSVDLAKEGGTGSEAAVAMIIKSIERIDLIKNSLKDFELSIGLGEPVGWTLAKERGLGGGFVNGRTAGAAVDLSDGKGRKALT